jgi:predicted RNA-binding protein with PIN domain
VARRGLSDDPPVPPPAGLRRYLGFTRLPTTVLQAIARVVEGDDEFRARVARQVGEADVGRAGWLWLNRPDGYLDELRKLEDEAEAVAAAEADDREERDARRRLAAAQSAADRAMATSRAQAEEIDELRAELLGERSRLADVAARLAEVDDELDRVRGERVRAVRQLKEVEARLAERTVELKQLKAQLRDVEAEPDRAGSSPPPPGTGAVSAKDGPAGGLAVAHGGSEGRSVDVGEPTTPPAPPAAMVAAQPSPAPRAPDAPGPTLPAAVPPIDPAALTRALRSAARGAAELAAALGEIEGVVAALGSDGGAPVPASLSPTGDLVDGSEPSRAPARIGEVGEHLAGEPAPSRREPLPLPGGLLDDSVEVVEHLLRAPGLLLLVDGYNVTMTGWPELPVGEQRRRLLGALGETAARTGTEVEVVFDGADVEPLSPPHQVRQMVRVRFSPPHVEADDVLLELLEQLPVARPVAVASSDNRVRDGARRLGANLLHAHQLAALLRR